MEISQFTALTGIAVTEATTLKYTAAIARAKAYLESLLGYALDKAGAEVSVYGDNPTFAYRLFVLNPSDIYIEVDPCTAVHDVTLVYPPGSDQDDESLELNEDYSVSFNKGLIKYIRTSYNNLRPYYCHNYPYMNVAVDADWIAKDNKIPEDLLVVWSAFAKDFSNENRDIKSETEGPYKYERFGKDGGMLQLHELREYADIIKKYTGPKGTMSNSAIV